MDSSSVFGTNQKVIKEEIERKTEEYRNKMEITMITQICESVEVRSNLDFYTVYRIVITFSSLQLLIPLLSPIKYRKYTVQNLK